MVHGSNHCPLVIALVRTVRVLLTIILAALAATSLAIGIWQFTVAMAFPLHRRETVDDPFNPAISILKPLKGGDAETAECLRSWMRQRYNGPMEVLFGVSSENDLICETVRELIKAYPEAAARLVICGDQPGGNPKISKVIELIRQSRHEVLCVSDADVFAEPDFLDCAVKPLQNHAVGLVSAFYKFPAGQTFAMRLEALAVNVDFWSQVLQARSLSPLRFALGAAMLIPREKLNRICGFESLRDFLADDYELGRRMAATRSRIEVAGSVVECRSARVAALQVWDHQVRWARTIRACRPWSYFLSIVANATLWPALWAALQPGRISATMLVFSLGFRIFAAGRMEARLAGRSTISSSWMILVKDFLQVGVWSSAFLGKTVIWQGVRYRVGSGGRLASVRSRPCAKKDAGAA